MPKKTSRSPQISHRERALLWATTSVLLLIITGIVSYLVEFQSKSWTIIVAMSGIAITGCANVAVAFCMRSEKGTSKKFSIRFWALAGMFFDRKTRALMYDPIMEEMHDDFLLARRLCRSKANYRWLKFCFTKRASLAWLRSLGVTVLVRPVLRLMPAWLKHWLNLFS